MATELLIATHAKNARFIPAVLQTVGQHWPGHPPATVLTDGGFEGDNVVSFPGLHFIALLAAGVEALGARTASPPSHIYLMLEDLCPLWPVDVATLRTVEAAALAADLPVVHFHFKPRRRWKRKDILCGPGEEEWVDGAKLFRWAPGFRGKNALQVSLWRRTHLAELCARMVRDGVDDPWTFEIADNPLADTHRVSALRWPTVTHGFTQLGKVNHRAVRNSRVAPSPLKTLLREEFCGGTTRLAVERRFWALQAGKLRGRFTNA
ncbi:MAG: hypothetical protein AAF318_16520 [Pseudomonadota bacterium]